MKSEIKCAYRVNFQTSQYWITVGIFIESRAGATTVAWIRRIDKYHQHKYHSHWMQCDRCKHKSVHTIYEFSLSVSPGYKISERSTQIIYLPYRALRIWRFALWIKTNDCSIFAKKKSPLDCMYGGDKEIWCEMLVLNEQAKQTGDIIFARGTTSIKNIRMSSRKKHCVER